MGLSLSLVEIVVMFLGERFRRSWLTAWISGILFTLTAIALGWTAMLLDWTQLGYWRFNIELGTVEAIPLMVHNCEQFSQVVELSTLSQSRTCTLCIVMFSQLELILAIIHLGGLLLQERRSRLA